MPETHVLLSKIFWKIFGIKTHRIGMEKRQAICLTPKQPQKPKQTKVIEIHIP